MHEDKELTPLETFRKIKRMLAEAAQQRLGADLDRVEAALKAGAPEPTQEEPNPESGGEQKPTVRGNPPTPRRTGA